MTNEEAREVLQEQIDKYGQEYDAKGIEALDMAIKALEQTELNPSYNSVKTELKSSEDCVSREEVLKVMCDKCPMYNCVTGCPSYRHIEKMPSVTPKGVTVTDFADRCRECGRIKNCEDWIPVSEKLPEDYIHVLCQFTLGGMGECYLAHGVFHVVGGLVMTCNEVIAWMPLPQPYKAESIVEQI